MKPAPGGIKLRQYRETQGLSQAALAELIGGGTNQSTVAKWEAGKFKPGVLAMRRLESVTNGAVTGADFFPELAGAA